jgi:CubicO group peptidase (beta-lactamase class C family)
MVFSDKKKNALFVTAVLPCVLLAVTGVACRGGNPAQEELARKVENVENGLVELDLASMNYAHPEIRMTLSERMAHYKVPGVSIAVIENNKVEWAKAYGVLDVESGTAVTTTSLFEAASTTKLLTGVIVLHFVERGQLDLDKDVNSYLKSWKIHDNEFTREQKVTLRRLLTHQSGINRPDGGFSAAEGSEPPLLQILKGEFPAQNRPATVEYVPGAKWQYSNMGYVVIQQVVEDVLGKPFAVVARETVFKPLGMTSSTLVYPLTAEGQEKEAVPHDAEGKAHTPGMTPAAVAHGGLISTPSDLALLAIDLMRTYQGRSARVISPATAKLMFSRELDINIMGFPLGEGVGVILRGEGKDFSFLHPGGNDPGATCWLEGVPESGRGIVIMSNGAMGDVLSLEILYPVIDGYRWATGQWLPVSKTDSSPLEGRK